MDDSIKLAKIWVDLEEIRRRLINEVIPVSGHLGIEDPDLMIAMEELAIRIEAHFDKFKLVAETKKQLVSSFNDQSG